MDNNLNYIKEMNEELIKTQTYIGNINNAIGVELKESSNVAADSISLIKDSINKIDIKSFSSDINSILSSTSTLYSSISSSFFSFFDYDLSIYDNAINEAKQKLEEFNNYQNELRESSKEKEDEYYNNFLARLDEELELAIENDDLMSAEGIRIKKEEIAKKKEEENKLLLLEKESNAQKELLERNLAEAEYKKDYAKWENEVKLAEMEKSKAIADAVLIPSLAIAKSALGVATSFAEGGLVGFAAGLAVSATTVASAISAASGIVSSTNALDSVKSNPPTPPKFAFGTTGYTIPEGGYAIVGEMGAELVRNNAGKITVQSNAQLNDNYNSRDSMYIENVIFNVSQVLTEEEVYKYMNDYKYRNSQMYVR